MKKARIQSVFPTPLAILLALMLTATGAYAREDTSFFESKIRPLLIKRCYECHSAEEKIKGGLRLDTQAGWKLGGDSGPAIVPGNSEKSLLFQAVSYDDNDLQMPPEGKLDDLEIEALKKWIESGAPDPRMESVEVAEGSGIDLEKGREFWSFKPPVKHPLPKLKNANWPQTEVDHFILAKQEQECLIPASDADRETLIRRAYFDLVGIPPRPEEIDAFLNDTSANAFEKVIDNLLSSPHFGERWGRRWLDIARFAESSGGGRALIFPNAWRYRDYVVNAFNQDKPYTQFVREQIAGDLLSSDSLETRAEQIIATGFLLLGPINYELQDKELLRMEVVDEQMTTVGKSMLGMTIGCARCHDHKFDPIPASDYYALAGIFRSSDSLVPGNVSGWERRFLPMAPDIEEKYAVLDKTNQALTKVKAAFKKIEKKFNTLKAAASPKTQTTSHEGIVIDDKDAELKGDWTSSNSTGKWVGENYIHDAQQFRGHKHARFTPKISEPGIYEIRVSWAYSGNRASNTTITIVSEDGEKIVTVNQKKEPAIDGLWHSLGQFTLAAGKRGYVQVSNHKADGVVIADAVQFIPLTTKPPKPRPNVLANTHPTGEVDNPELVPFIVPDPDVLPGVVIDDTQARVIGQWQQSTHTPPYVGYSYIHDMKDGKGEKQIIFETKLPKSGMYEVRMSHCYNIRRATNAPITIHHADGETTLRINEQELPAHDKLFRTLGKFRFEKDALASVTISNEGTEGKYVIADAVQFISIDELKEREFKLAELEKVRKQLLAKRREREDLDAQVARMKRYKLPPRAQAMAMKEAEDAGDYFLAVRGNIHKLGPQIPRGFLSVAWQKDAPPKIAEKSSGRLEFADWIASRENPLTARVMVNRIWHHLLGRGLVSTPDNFGAAGMAPTHPELLDWLAVDFMDNGWSVKQAIKRVMLSRVYQISTSANSTNPADKDPNNFLLSHALTKRLDAEAIRDSMLFVSGELNATVGGKTIPGDLRSEFDYTFTGKRRSLYSPVFRNNLEDIFNVFDFANPNLVAGKRGNSAVATQALYLMNSPFVRERAEAAAKRIIRSDSETTAARIKEAYRQTLSRSPTAEELRLATEFLGDESSGDQLANLTDLCQSLFACVDFRFLN